MVTNLTRQEKEKVVVELYKQGMNYAQIAKDAHVSVRDIGPILNRAGEHQSLSKSSQAYKMFSEGSTLIQVAIALDLKEKEVSEYYREYWNLNGMYHLNQIYEEIKYDIWSVIELHRRIQTERLSPQQVSRILKMTTTLERNNRDLEGEQARLEVSNKQAAQTFQQLTDLIQKDNKTLEENYSVISQQKREIENLNIEKARLENTLNSIHNTNEIYVKIKQAVKQEIESTILHPRQLIRLSLASLFESERKHPGRLRALYYNMPPTLSVEQVLSHSSISQNEQFPSQFGHEGSIENLLLDEAEQSYNRIANAITNTYINEIPNETKSLAPIVQVPDVQDIGSNHEIFDTGDLSQVNLVYNNITFQLHPGSNIANEISSDSDGRPRKDKLDISGFLQDQQK